ncbi:MAG: hypothetical protein ABI818_06130 [Acidobacteriota bacterium]
MAGSSRLATRPAVSPRIFVALWMVLGVLLWNGIFEMLVVRGVKEYLFRAALFDARRGPQLPIAAVMEPAIFNATWVATLWTSIVLLAAFLTMRLLQPRTRLE